MRISLKFNKFKSQLILKFLLIFVTETMIYLIYFSFSFYLKNRFTKNNNKLLN